MARTDSEQVLILLDHIITTHHGYVRRTIPDIAGRLRVLVTLAADERPELRLVAQTFEHLAASLLSHLDKEEHLVFPYLRDLAMAQATGARLPLGPFGTLANPLRMMEDEHLDVRKALDCIRDLTHRYQPPAIHLPGLVDCYEALRLFDADLRTHIHVEEHDLYPRGLDLEARLT